MNQKNLFKIFSFGILVLLFGQDLLYGQSCNTNVLTYTNGGTTYTTYIQSKGPGATSWSNLASTNLSYTGSTNNVQFRLANLPPIDKLSGYPDPKYKLIWVYDDGDYEEENITGVSSNTANPVFTFGPTPVKNHYFQSGSHTVRVYLTDNYGGGGNPPPSMLVGEHSFTLTTNATTSAVMHNPLTGKSLDIDINHQPRGKDYLLSIIRLKNTSNNVIYNGVLTLKYNGLYDNNGTTTAFLQSTAAPTCSPCNSPSCITCVSCNDCNTGLLYCSLATPKSPTMSFLYKQGSLPTPATHRDYLEWHFGKPIGVGEEVRIFAAFKVDQAMAVGVNKDISMLAEFSGSSGQDNGGFINYSDSLITRICTVHDPNGLSGEVSGCCQDRYKIYYTLFTSNDGSSHTAGIGVDFRFPENLLAVPPYLLEGTNIIGKIATSSSVTTSNGMLNAHWDFKDASLCGKADPLIRSRSEAEIIGCSQDSICIVVETNAAGAALLNSGASILPEAYITFPPQSPERVEASATMLKESCLYTCDKTNGHCYPQWVICLLGALIVILLGILIYWWFRRRRP